MSRLGRLRKIEIGNPSYVKLNALLSKEEPGLIRREEFEKLNTEVRDLNMQQQKEKNEK